MKLFVTFAFVVSLFALTGCDESGAGAEERIENAEGETATIDLEGETATPPFAVAGDLEGLMLTYFDDEGAHTAPSRDEIPEASRDRVRVDSLNLAPDQRLDPDYVYIADVRHEVEGAYPVRKLHRDALEQIIDRATGATARRAEAAQQAELAQAAGDPADADIIIYGAEWCGACKSAASYLRGRGVAFVERDVEQDPGARAEMQRKAQAAGVRPSGIPVIDFRGTILTGFDRSAMERLLSQGARAI